MNHRDFEAEGTSLYSSIIRQIQYPAIRAKLRQFGLDHDDAAHDLWLALIPYTRRTPIREMDAYVRRWIMPVVNRLIDHHLRHRKRQDRREII